MPTLDDIRADGEAALDEVLAKLDERHKLRVKAAIKQYGRVQDIPESFWDEIKREIEEEVAAALLFAIIIADEWTSDEIGRQGQGGIRRFEPDLASYGLAAGRTAIKISDETTATVRDRLQRKVEDQTVSPAGGVGTLTDQGIDEALGDVYTRERRETIAIDGTTQALTTGQRGAAERGDGASTTTGQRVELELYWVTERDNRVCMRCAPLHDKPESVWGRVFPNGPGPEAHPRCRCSLRPVVVVAMSAQESEEKGRWVTIRGNAVKISDDGVILTGPMKGKDLDDFKSDKGSDEKGDAPARRTEEKPDAEADMPTKFKSAAQAEKAMSEKTKDWRDGLSHEEQMGVKGYAGTANSFMVNDGLRNGGKFKTPTAKITAERMTKALDKAAMPETVKAFRAINPKSEAERAQILAGFEKSVGKAIVDKAFVSTTVNAKYADTWGKNAAAKPIRCEVLVPKGAKAAYMSKEMVGRQEWEVTIQRGSKFKVKAVSGDTVYLEMAV